jgi:hypothetical protein
MAYRSPDLADLLGGDLADQWKRHEGSFSRFLESVGLTGDEYSQCIYIHITPAPASNPTQYLDALAKQIDPKEQWAYATLTGDLSDSVIVFPVSKKFRCPPREAFRQTCLALFVEVHSTLVTWWLINAWRSKQLTDATWHLADAMQVIPSAACARSLIETAATVWVDIRTLHEKWSQTKRDCAANGPSLTHWQELKLQIHKMLWGGKFDSKVPDWEKAMKHVQRTHVQTQIDKLAKVTKSPLQRDYQWLCNVVHPSMGGTLAFASPLIGHDSNTHSFQYVHERPLRARTVELAGEKHMIVESRSTLRWLRNARDHHPGSDGSNRHFGCRCA